MSEPTINTAAELAQNHSARTEPVSNDTRKTLTIARSPQALELRERLQKVLATSGLGARRGMEERILKGEITLNGAVPELGAQVKVGDRIGVDERIFVVKMQEGDFGRILLYNKPDGEVTTRHDPEGRKTVFETLPRLRGSRWIAVGRLDINTQGLLVFTTNGDLAQKLMHPENEFEREYLCRVHGEVTEEIVAKLLAGVELEDGPAAVSLIESMDSAGGSNEWWRVVIKEGRNREIRRLWEAVGLTVSRLKRASFGPFTLPKGLHRGELAELDLSDTQKICIEMGISQTPSQLIAEDEAASRLRRNRVVEGLEVKKRFIAAGKGKAEAFWTGERGYGGAGSRPVRAGGGEFDLGGAPGSERPRDGRPKRGKGGPMRGKPGAGRAAFVGPMGMSSFDANAQNPGGPNLARGPRGPRSNAPGNANGGNVNGPRNDRRGQRRGPSPSTPLVDADGAPILSSDGQPRFAPRPNRHRSGPRPAGGRPVSNVAEGATPGLEPGNTGAERSRVPREPGAQRGRGPRRDAGPGRSAEQNPGQRRDRPAGAALAARSNITGAPRVGDIGNRIGESVGRKRVGFMRGALGTAETYDARLIHADSEDFGNRIAGAQPRPPRPDNGGRGNRPPRGFSGPMDNAHPREHDGARPEVDGNSARPDGNRQAHVQGVNPNPRNPNGRGRGDQRGRNANGAPQANREPRPPREARPPGEARPQSEARPQGEARPLGEARPPRPPRPPGEARPPRAPAFDANGAAIERAPNDGRPRNRNRRRRGPRPEGSAPAGSSPTSSGPASTPGSE